MRRDVRAALGEHAGRCGERAVDLARLHLPLVEELAEHPQMQAELAEVRIPA